MNENQKRALGIGGIGVAAFLYLRSHRATARSAPPQPTTGNVAPFTPQSPVILSPGESVYDPNSQGFLTTPLSPQTTDPGLSVPPATSPDSTLPAPQPTAPSSPSYTINVQYPPNPKTTTHRAAPRKRKPAVKRPTVHHTKPAPKPKPKPRAKRKPVKK